LAVLGAVVPQTSALATPNMKMIRL